MSSNRTSKLKSQRPVSSARVYDYENTEYGTSERRSKIPKIPRRTYSLERDSSSSCRSKKPINKLQHVVSMIPRPESKRNIKKVENSEGEDSPISDSPEVAPETQEPSKNIEKSEKENKIICRGVIKGSSETAVNDPSEESQGNEDFVKFKNNVLRIPEYWTDAGQTVTNILKNAINIVTKQYPSADVETFEAEIQNILKATEAIKQQILVKTESIINQANKLYSDRTGGGELPTEEELRKIQRTMVHLRNEVHVRKNVFGDLLKCSAEMKQLVDLEKTLNQKRIPEQGSPKSSRKGTQHSKEEANQKYAEGKKSKMKIETTPRQSKTKVKNKVHSCGDVFGQEMKSSSATPEDGKFQSNSQQQSGDKSCQTTPELDLKEDLNTLNQQILELHQLCKDHISKFKSFNLQIKLRGICSKAQNLSASKEIQILNDEKLKLAEKNNKLYFYNKDLESAIKQKDLDLHQKDRLISQQKKLLHVRDELIEMLKSRCRIEDVEQA